MAIQQWHDHKRRTYRLESFPLELDEAAIAAWLRAITGTLRPPLLALSPSPVIVLEVWGDKDGITHRVSVPWQHHEYVIGQLRSHVPGIHVVEERVAPTHNWKQAVEVKLAHGGRTLGIVSSEETANTIFAPLQQLRGTERVLMQWVITPAMRGEPPQHNKAKTTDLKTALLYGVGSPASRDEVEERRKKLEEPNMMGVLRLAADAETDIRASHLLDDVRKAFASARGIKAHFIKRLVPTEVLMHRIESGKSPLSFPIQLSLSELTSLLGWPIGKSFVPGISISMSRRLPPSSLIPSSGRILGRSNAHGNGRDIAVSYRSAVRHTHCVGRTGTGKSTLLTNMAVQDMKQGYGVIVIEAKDDLFNQVLDCIPTPRVDDVIVLDVNDGVRPVGFNIFDQGNNRTAIDELSVLISAMYKDTSQSLMAPQMLYHLTHALAEIPGATLMDLPTLMTPQSASSPAGIWRDYVGRQVKDQQVSNYLQTFLNMAPAEQNRVAAPLFNRTWEFTSRPEVRAILGQRTSSFKMRDVIEQNKILLVSLSGARVGSQTASLMGTLLVNSIWQAVRSITPDKPSFLYLDEFADFMNLPVDIESILSKSRSAKLGMVLAHQNLAQISPQLREGVMANTATKIALRTSARDAGLLVREFSQYIDETDLVGLPDHEAIALVATDRGSAPPVTFACRPPARTTNNAGRVRGLSQLRYGRSVKDVERDLAVPQLVESQQPKRPKLSGEGWGA